MRRMLISNVPLALVFLASTLGCTSGDGSAPSTRYLMTGSSTVAPIMQKVAEQLETVDPSFRIDVQTGGSTRGIVDASEGRNDCGMASRDLKPEEKGSLTIYPLAYDGIALIANASNSIEGVTGDQVKQLFTKEISDWSALGSDAGEVHIVNKAEGRATLEIFLEHFGLENRDIEADAVIGDNAQGVRLVAATPNAVGYVSIGEALHAIQSGESIKLLALDGVQPTLTSVGDGTFPIRRTLYLLFPGELDARDQQLIDHVEGLQGKQAIESLRFIPAKTPE